VPLFWVSLAIIAGLLLGNDLPWSRDIWLILAGGFLLLWPLLSLGSKRFPRLRALRWLSHSHPFLLLPPILLLIAAPVGALRMATSGPDIANGHIQAFNDQGEVQLIALVDSPPDRRDQTTLYHLQAEEIAPLDALGRPEKALPTHGAVVALVRGRANWQYGDRLRLTGQLTTPSEGETFSYRAYLARQNVYSYLAYPQVRRVASGAGNPILALLYSFRDQAYHKIYQLFPAPEAPLLAGILLGIDSDIPDALTQAFQATGTAHVIAISGFNIAILAKLFSELFGRFLSRWWATLISILAITLYTLMVGAMPSVVRAAIMGSLALVAQQIGRRTGGVNGLAMTAAGMCLFDNPHLLWDVSFQLSFGATLGLILYGDPLQTGLTRFLERRLPVEKARRIAGPIGEYFLLTLSAQLLTLPITLYHFQRLSVSALLANPLILPPQPLVMVLSGVAVLLGMLSEPLGHLAAWFAWPFAAYTNRMVELLATIPGGVLVLGEFNLWTVLLMYVVLLVPALGKRFSEKIRSVLTPTLPLAILALAAVLAWRGVAALPDGKLHLRVFDLDHQQVLLIAAPGGETLLVNGGPSPRQLNNTLDRWLSPFDRSLDGLLITQEDASAWSGLNESLESHPVRRMWWGVPPNQDRTGRQLVETLQNQQSASQALAPGSRLMLGDQVSLQIVAAGETNSALWLTWQNFRALAPGGIAPNDLPDDVLNHSSVLLLNQDDLEGTTPDEWLSYAPEAVLATPGSSAFLPTGRNWINTYSQGWISLQTDGQRMWLETQ
jgi:competence protein ComEC